MSLPAPLPTTAVDRQSELDQLSLRLEDRLSILHFAWAFGFACVAFVMGGVAIKLFRDSIAPPKVAYVLAAASALEVIVGLVRLNRGLQLYQRELADFERMLALRGELGCDRPRLPAA